MRLKEIKIGFALPISHCLFSDRHAVDVMEIIYQQIKQLMADGAKVYPLLFFKKEENGESSPRVKGLLNKLAALIDQEPATLSEEELYRSSCFPPNLTIDLLVIAPCPENVAAYLCEARPNPGATNDAPLHLHLKKPIVLALTTTNSDPGHLLSRIPYLIQLENIFLVPLGPVRATKNKLIVVTRMSLIVETCLKAIAGQQLQPFFWEDHWIP